MESKCRVLSSILEAVYGGVANILAYYSGVLLGTLNF